MYTGDMDKIFIGFNLATMSEGADSFGEIKDNVLGVTNGKISWIGRIEDIEQKITKNTQVVKGNGEWITPGLIDCHTHIIYGSDRSQEFEQRLNGASYEEIAKSGGGINSTVLATRQASEESLLASAQKRLNAFIREGVTTLEVKSGYGLDVENEIKLLSVADKLDKQNDISIVKTFLGAHTIPNEFKSNPEEYVELICHSMIPKVANGRLADTLDIFTESVNGRTNGQGDCNIAPSV